MSFMKQGVTLKDLLQNPELLNFSGPKAVASESEKKDGKKSKDISQEKPTFSGQSAFLGQNVWDKTLPYDPSGDFKDFKLEYMDLDEFLNENCIPTNEELNQLVGELSSQNMNDNSSSSNPNLTDSVMNDVPFSTNLDQSFDSNGSCSPRRSTLEQHLTGHIETQLKRQNSDSSVESVGKKSPKVDVDFDIDPHDLELARIPGQNNFDPRKAAFSEEELRPQPIIKKSRKIFVPEDSKDEKYWHRRKKNNVAAKRSREARRIKENQITLRAAYLEKENKSLKGELLKIKEENAKLKSRLSLYE